MHAEKHFFPSACKLIDTHRIDIYGTSVIMDMNSAAN